ncbi:MAG: hypothetical protein AB4368_11440 [Xenococcaceae cyanobacterium]
MYRSPYRGKIRPKLSSMPVQRSEARVHLNVYKLAVEKERIEKELSNLEARRQQLRERLGILNYQIEQDLLWAKKSRDRLIKGLNLSTKNSQNNNYVKTMTLNY